MKIIQEKSKCIGCGTCASLCSKYFEMEEVGKANLKNSKMIDEKNDVHELEIKEGECAKDAADACPVQCIIIKK